MYRLTKRRKEKAREILDRYTQQLYNQRSIDGPLERELRELWKVGYQELKWIMIDMLEKHPEYAHLAAHYMEYSNGPGVVMEFQGSLAEVYGLSSWYYDAEKEKKRAAFWERAFALNSRFDLEGKQDGLPILQISSIVDAKLIEYFLKHPRHLRSMRPRDFEDLIAGLFDGFGYTVEQTQSTRDGGYDIVAIGNRRIAASKYLIECKCYAETNKVGVRPVRALHGVVNDKRATKGILVTTSSFTPDARTFMKRNQWVLEGRAFDGIVDWLREYQRLKFPPTGDFIA